MAESPTLEGHQFESSESRDESAELASTITGDAFDAWYREREYAQNIREGKPYFNGAPTQRPPKKHSPSKLLQCHRKAYYQHYNAPRETESPDGIFWFGEQFETEVAVPFLRSLLGDNRYLRNSMWIDIETTVEGEEIRIRGETDPVIVDRESTPVLLTEIKTTSSVEYLEEPKDHHKAQIHAYLRGLSEQHDSCLQEAVILYAARDSFEVKTFQITFDQEYWAEIADWAGTQTTYRNQERLPPSAPAFEWECEYCSYRERCGKGDSTTADATPVGLVPGVKYPRSKVVDYLEAHDGGKLTPTTASQHPDLTDTYPVREWQCPVCHGTWATDSITWDPESTNQPLCPSCCDQQIPAELTLSEESRDQSPTNNNPGAQ